MTKGIAVLGMIFAVAALTVAYSAMQTPAAQGQVTDKLKCSSDMDCVAGGECCHPSQCVNDNYAQWFQKNNCNNTMCTQMCAPCPTCECVDGQCTKTGETSVEEGACC